MLNNLKPSIFWIVYLFGGKVNYHVHHPFCQLHKHNCGLRRNSRVKSFSFYHLYRSVEDISLLIKYLNPRKATGSDFIPLKVIKFVWNVIDPHLHNNKRPRKKQVFRRAKSSIFKKNERNKVRNYRPVSILNGMSKISERFIHNSLFYVETILSHFIPAYRKSYSTNHVLLRLLENWKKSLDNKNFVGPVLIGSLKGFWLYFSWFT